MQLSDTHIRKSENFNLNIFNKAIEQINKLHPDYIIHLGDITEEGTKEDYELAKKLLSKIKKPIIYIIGNHDARNVGYELFSEYFGSIKPVFFDDQILITGFDSTIPDRDGGRLGETSLRLLKKTLKEKGKQRIKIVAFHHHLLPVPKAGRERSMIVDAGDVLKTILENDVDIVLNGHRHQPNIYRIKNTMVVNSGTVSHYKTRKGSYHSFNIINLFPKEKIKVKIYNIENQTQKTLIKRTKKHKPPKATGSRIVRIVQISDTHFTDAPEFSKSIYEKAAQIINELNPDLVIHCGDLTHDGLVSSYEIAKKELSKINVPKLIVPGPHDLLHLGHIPFQGKINELNTTFTSKNGVLTVFGINSSQYDEDEGLIGRTHLQSIIKRISKAAKKQAKIVAFHHHILPLPHTREKHPIEDAGDVLRDLIEINVDMILTGHRHVTSIQKIDNTIVINANTLSSKRILAKHENSFNLIDIFKNGNTTITEITIETGKQKNLATYKLSSLKKRK